jgi:hypothetical protein
MILYGIISSQHRQMASLAWYRKIPRFVVPGQETREMLSSWRQQERLRRRVTAIMPDIGVFFFEFYLFCFPY